VVVALAACASGTTATAGPDSAQRLAAVEQKLLGTVHTTAGHDLKVLRTAVTAGDPSLVIEENCVGGGFLSMTVDMPGHAPSQYAGACNAPRASGVLTAGVTYSPDKAGNYGTAKVVVHPAKAQEYWIGIGAAKY
jgi:hypothetical protein